MGKKFVLKIESFAFFDSSRFMTTSLPEFNAHIERLWLLAIYSNTNLRSAVEWLNGTQQLTIKAMAPPVRIWNSYRKIRYYFKIHTGGDNMH